MRFFGSARWLILAFLVTLVPATSRAGVFISINFGPPVLPVYEQPICPEPNLIWMPGYWAYGEDGYFWVPGAWVPAPFEGGLWTPPYWGWNNGLYMFHPGYWGYHVGYYGGVNYGYGYGGIGFAGGEWRGHNFAYNTAVMHVDERRIHTTYIDRTIVERNYVARNSHVAYSGGPGGIHHDPAPQERFAEREQHTPPTSFQTQHFNSAQSNKQYYAKFNGGRPSTLAVARPLPVETHPAPPLVRPVAGPVGRFGANENGGRPNYPVAPRNGATGQPPTSFSGRPNNTVPNTSVPDRAHPGFNSNPNAGVAPRSPELRQPPPSGNNNVAPRNDMRQVTPPHNNVAPRNEMREVTPPHYNPPPPHTNTAPPPPKQNARPAEKGRPEHN